MQLIQQAILDHLEQTGLSRQAFSRSLGCGDLHAIAAVLRGKTRVGSILYARLERVLELTDAHRAEVESNLRRTVNRRKATMIARSTPAGFPVLYEDYPCETCPHFAKCKSAELACKAFFDYTLTDEVQRGGDWRTSEREPSAAWFQRTFADDVPPAPRTHTITPPASPAGWQVAA